LPAALYNWTGFYLGINGGFGTGHSNWSDGVIGTTGSFPTSGFLVGGTAGVNYQIAEYVFGIEGDGDWTNLRGNSGSTCGAISAVVTPPVSCQTQSRWLATVRGRCTTAASCGGAAGSIVSFNENVIRAGINYKFGPW
jgi:outer membrane immunogenic protein